MRRLVEGRTTITIAHRLTTVQAADRILVLHRGRVHEEGAHAELLRRRGLYARLWELGQSAAPV
jgi:ATP-binding cassette subfamily B protein